MNLSIGQKKAIHHVEGPALILAVPGAGKTTVLIHRTVNLILNHKISPERILSITFSKSSARDMKERFNKSFSEISSIPIQFSTIHSFCFGLIREYAYINRIKYTLIEEEKNELNKYNVIKKIYFATNQEYITEEKLESLLNSIGYIKNMMLSADEFLKHNKSDIENFKIIYDAYEKYKKDNNLIDFDDMLTIALEILESNTYILEKYRTKYDFIQVDEGQDTSKVQLEIIKLLASPKNNLFIVADDDQSIYGFRGAYPKGLLNFNKIYPNGKLFFMEENYRSSKNIVSVCSQFIKKNTLRYNKNISTNNNFIEPINIVKFNSIDEEYKYLVKDLKTRELSRCCILYRNNLSSIGLIELLERNKIPFTMKDIKVRFFNHWLIQDIINFIIFSKDTTNMNIYENIYYKTKGYISKKQINYAKTLNYNLSIFDRIMDFPGLSNFYKSTLKELKLDFKKLGKLSPSDAITFIEHELEYEKYLKENSMKFGYTYDVLKTIIYYLKFIANNSRNLDELLNRLKYLEHLCRNSRSSKNAVTLSTIHSAKGLEFDRVYMIDLVDGDFPSISSIEAYEKGKYELIEEERRLFYVGMSRAKYHLSLITINNIGEKKVEPSRFLLDLEKKKA
ncbi:ATP-dependent helicase [Tissierella praeacuta]|uniref:ATP-dependent helicase n=1 Tax=Tissierella praeacuta TaxID=43131 RepID=UPI001042AE35|nr:ATP-dependent helicase [Tissierella praeacuta]TCU75660.1 DNA helicase-2/ATP-dependent DNA helicase PcrA [Tissierella praeacuta]